VVISHQHKFVFIEHPWTGTTSISRVLIDSYGGKKILFRHASYFDFLKIATKKEKNYFVFSSIRNPLDIIVSNYFKYKTDHGGRYSGLQKSRNFDHYLYFHRLKRFEFVKNSKNFSEYFLKYCKFPFNSWVSLSPSCCAYIIRFENIDDDFNTALKMIGINNPKPLPRNNITGSRERDFSVYYSPQAINRAKKVFGFYMKKLGYEFPTKWGDCEITWHEKLQYNMHNLYRELYWKHLRYHVFKYSTH